VGAHATSIAAIADTIKPSSGLRMA
jgi:hypothetical protein